jgi:hypothetical protein
VNLQRMLSAVLAAIPDPMPVARSLEEHAHVSVGTQSETLKDYAHATNTLAMYLGEHHAVIGATGSGKTFYTLDGLLPYLHTLYPHAKRYILDSTSDPDMLRHVPHALVHTGNMVPPLLHSAAYTQIWTPDNSRIPTAYAAWFDKLNDCHEPMIVVVDEVASITREALLSLEALLKQARKHGGTVIALTQQIAKCDTTIFSQVSHLALFNIGSEVYDLARARALLGMSKVQQRPPHALHGFYYRRTRGNHDFKEISDSKQFFSQRREHNNG